jgi:hypothetical protein
MEQRPILGALMPRAETMYDLNGRVRATEVVAEIGNESLAFSCRRVRTTGGPGEVRRQSSRDRDRTKHGERTAINYEVTIDQNLVLAVSAMDLVDFRRELTPKCGCHTGSVEASQSVGAVTNHDSRHVDSSSVRVVRTTGAERYSDSDDMTVTGGYLDA